MSEMNLQKEELRIFGIYEILMGISKPLKI